MKLLRTFAIALLLTTATSQAWSRGAETLKIVAFGDSTTARRSTVKQVYADRLTDLLAKCGVQVETINAGVGGSHTGHVLDNRRHKRQHALDRFQSAVLSARPDVVVIQFGINDSWVDEGGPQGASRIPLCEYRANLTYIVKTLKKDGVQVILMTPNGLGNRHEAWRHQRLSTYAHAVRKIAANERVGLADVWKFFDLYAF